jgi:BRI1 kinase inhibitor 1
VGESVNKASTSSSEVSTMEELQSAIQAAIAHCKNSVAAAGDKQQRKC